MDETTSQNRGQNRNHYLRREHFCPANSGINNTRMLAELYVLSIVS